MSDRSLARRMVSVGDAAKILGVCPATVRRNLPLQRLGNRTLIRLADVREITGEGACRDVA